MSLDTASHNSHGLVAHHFENLDQQRDASSLGMWLFLASEILFFGGLFTSYTILRSIYPQGFAQGSRLLNPTLGGINTAVLLTSSLTMALAVWASQTGQRRLLQLFLALTLLFGATFLGIKAYEWSTEYEHGQVPGVGFHLGHQAGQHSTPGEERPTYDRGEALESLSERTKQVEMFFVFYFIITGLHGLHMLVGLGVLGVQLALALRSNFGIDNWGPIEVSGLYWHFVDIVWIFVFPLLYLLRT